MATWDNLVSAVASGLAAQKKNCVDASQPILGSTEPARTPSWLQELNPQESPSGEATAVSRFIHDTFPHLVVLEVKGWESSKGYGGRERLGGFQD